MSNKLFGSQIACGNSDRPRSKSDFYPTPPDVTVGLLQYLGLPKDTMIWDPAYGDGDMVKIFRKMANKNSYGTDIIEGIDFLKVKGAGATDWIITNPPFSLAEEFIEHCVELNKPFALLLKTQFFHAARRTEFFRRYQPTEVLPLTWRPDFLFKTEGKHGAPLMEVCWCVWEGKNRNGVTFYRPLERPSKELMKEIMGERHE